MEIEIVTIKRRLTKSLVSQMPKAIDNDLALLTGEVLGHFRNVIKYEEKSILIKYDGNYYTIPMDIKWMDESLENEPIFVVTNGYHHMTVHRTFDTSEQLEAWWTSYERVLKAATKQIYVYY